MELALFLAQSGHAPDEAINWAERMSRGGVAVICLVVAIAAVVGLIFIFKKLLDKSEEFKDLEKNYRKTIEDKAKEDRVDADNRLKEAKTEADKRADREMAIMKERLAAEKESDATLAQAVHVIERNITLADKVDKRLEAVEALLRKVDEVNDRLRRLEERRA